MNLALRCTVCECLLKDSLTWVDHINGRKHNRFLGMTMQVEKKSPAETYGPEIQQASSFLDST